MKIAISASAQDLSSPVDPRFGRCPYYIFIDPDSMQFEVLENPNITSAHGAGIQAAQLVANKGVNVLLTGSCGPNAFQTLQAAGVNVIVGVSGTIQEAVQKFKSGQLQSAAQANVPPHFGTGTGGGSPTEPGFGMGGGMGRGMGRGMGGFVDPGAGYGPTQQATGLNPPPGPAQPSPQEELNSLKQQAEFLRQQMEVITKRIKDLEEKK